LSSLRSLRLCDLCVNSFSVFFLFLALAEVSLSGCSSRNQSDPSSITFLIESSPTNLDPRFATDSQSQRIDGLLYSGLLERDNQMNFTAILPNPGRLPTRSLMSSISAAAFASTMAARSPPPT